MTSEPLAGERHPSNTHRERERGREREAHTQRDTHTERDTHTQRETHTERETQRETHTHTHTRERERHTHTHTHTHRERHTHTHTHTSAWEALRHAFNIQTHCFYECSHTYDSILLRHTHFYITLHYITCTSWLHSRLEDCAFFSKSFVFLWLEYSLYKRWLNQDRALFWSAMPYVIKIGKIHHLPLFPCCIELLRI